LGSATHKRSSCSGYHLSKTAIAEGMGVGDFGIHVPREVLSNVRRCRTWPDNGSQAPLLQPPVGTADVLQHTTPPTCVSSQKANHREIEWSVPWRNEGFSGPGTSLRENLVHLRYTAYVTATAPLRAANCLASTSEKNRRARSTRSCGIVPEYHGCTDGRFVVGGYVRRTGEGREDGGLARRVSARPTRGVQGLIGVS